MPGCDVNQHPSISADGRYVGISKGVLDVGQNEMRDHVFLFDRQTGQTQRITSPDGSNYSISSMSADGRFLAINSFFYNSTTNGVDYVYDRQTGLKEKVSVSSGGIEANNSVDRAEISTDGRYVVFSSDSTNLVDGVGAMYTYQVYIHDLQTSITELASISSDGIYGDYSSRWASISSDGMTIVFHSAATNLISPAQTDFRWHVYAHKFLEAPPSVYAISGKITLQDGTPIQGVNVTTDKSQTTVTDSNGQFTFSKLLVGTYLLTPSKAGYIFDPTSVSVPVTNANVSNINIFGGLQPVIPPTTITDLAVEPGVAGGEVILSWTAPSGTTPVTQYDIRYSNAPIINWASATRAIDPLAPLSPGTEEQISIKSLGLGINWYFAIKSAGSDNSWSLISNQPSFRDSGFRPYPNGYQFKNYVNQQSDFTPNDFRAMFGDTNVCANSSCSKFKPNAQKYFETLISFIMNPNCASISITSERFYLFPALLPAKTTYDIPLAMIRKKIAFTRAGLMMPSIQSQFYASMKQTPSQVLDFVQNSLSSTGTANTMISIYKGVYLLGWKTKNGDGHAVIPYAVQDVGGGIWRIWVYDSNHPFNAEKYFDDQQYIEINKNLQTWSFDGGLKWSGNLSSKTIGAVPINTFSDNEPLANCPWCTGAPYQVMVNRDAPLAFTNSTGNKFGYDGVTFLEDIPGAFVSSDPEISTLQNPIYYLPSTDEYTVQIGNIPAVSLSSTIASTSVTFSIFGPNSHISVSGVSSQDTLNFSNGNHVALQASGANTATFEISTNDASGGYQYQLSDVPTGSSQPVSISVDAVTKKVTYINPSGQSGSYTLNVETVNEQGVTSFSKANIPVAPNDTQFIDVSTISSGYVTVAIDHNSDGVIDQTIPYKNSPELKVYLPAIRR
jgi:hypothetical protein